MIIAKVKLALYLTLNLRAFCVGSTICKASHTDVPKMECTRANTGQA
jgi:hypothetical protein